MSFSAPELLSVAHDVSRFDCGSEPLNTFLRKYALQNNAAGVAKTYVTPAGVPPRVVGYYSLAAASVERSDVPERVAKGVPLHPVPVVLLARLAVDREWQGQGLGKGLLKDALLRALTAAETIGIRAILVHAKDAAAARFYAKFGFIPSPSDPLHLLLLVKDVKRNLAPGRD